MKRRACPVALHPDGSTRRIAFCQHPQNALIAGDLGVEERADAIAARLLFAQCGLETRAALSIGTLNNAERDIEWHFALCRIVPPVREQWQHLHAADTALLKFIWLPLDTPFPEVISNADVQALNWIKSNL